MLLGTLGYLYLGRNVAVYKDNFFVMTASVTVIAATAYLAMALGMGRMTLNGEEVLFARYVDWLLTTPILLALLGMIANAKKEVIATLVGLDVYMVATGFLGAVAEPLWQTAVWWAVSMFSFIALLYILLGVLSKGADGDGTVASVYTKLRNLTVVMWSLYPVVWIAGGNGFGVLSPTVEVSAFVVLDVLAKVVFGFVLLNSHESLRIHSFYGDRSVRTERRSGTPGEPAD